jgi:hypothetical protein
VREQLIRPLDARQRAAGKNEKSRHAGPGRRSRWQPPPQAVPHVGLLPCKNRSHSPSSGAAGAAYSRATTERDMRADFGQRLALRAALGARTTGRPFSRGGAPGRPQPSLWSRPGSR